jgi:hypothetical protein
LKFCKKTMKPEMSKMGMTLEIELGLQEEDKK